MKVHTVTVRFGAKVGLPNYSNIEAAVEVSGELEEGESFELATVLALETARNIVKSQLKARDPREEVSQ